MNEEVNITKGIFQGNKGVIIGFDGEKFTIEFEIYGRKINIASLPDEIDLSEKQVAAYQQEFQDSNKILPSAFKPVSQAFASKIAEAKKLLAEYYPLKLPEDFYAFWEFWQELSQQDYFEKFKGDFGYGLDVYGPFWVLQNSESNIAKTCYEESRYFNDPAEFFNVLVGHSDGFHYGYWADDVKDDQYYVVSYYHNDAWEVNLEGYNLFEAFRLHLETEISNTESNITYNYFPEEKESLEQDITTFENIREILKKYCTSERTEIGKEYIAKYGSYAMTKLSNRQITAKTRDGMGIVVPSKKYKPLQYFTETTDTWETILEDKTKLLNLYNQALAETENGFPGTALELGRDLWVDKNGRDLALELLEKAYEKLDRTEFKIALEVRRKVVEAANSKQKK